MKEILRVEGLTVYYYTLEGVVKAVRDVSFELRRGESLCLVGESGSGKSTLGLAIMGTLPTNAKIVRGKILFDGVDIVSLGRKELEEIRGKRISIIFQDPVATFNPLFTVGEVLEDVLRYKLGLKGKEALRRRALESLKLVGLPDAERVYRSYPHELSGGILQRVAIAVALSTSPELLIADEPTTMLDVTLQAQILDLLQELRRRLGLSVIYITHNLGVAATVCDRVMIIYAGSVMELGPIDEILLNPLHPYTKRLIECVPRSSIKTGRLRHIPGMLPDLLHLPKGCVFEPRCEESMEECKVRQPKLMEVRPGHFVACLKCCK